MPHKLSSLFLAEEEVVRVLESITRYYRSDLIKRYLLSVEDRVKEVPLLEKDELENSSLLENHMNNLLEKCVSNPVHVYSLLARLTKQLVAVRLEMEGKQEAKEVAANIDSILKSTEFPTDEDMEGAAQSTARIQFVYKLNPIDLAMGVVGRVSTKARLAGEDCLDIARSRYSGERPLRPWLNKEYALAVEWGEAALEMIDEEEEAVTDFVKTVKEEHDKYWVSPVGNRGNFPNEEFFVEKFENRNISGKVLRLKEKDFIAIQNNSLGFNIHDFYALCRGEEIGQTKIHMTSKLCKFTTQRNPYFTLSPLKLEILSDEPSIYMFHQVLTLNEIQLLKSASIAILKSSKIEDREGGLKVTNGRTQANGWLWDHQHQGLYQMSLKTEKMTGLNVANKELLDSVAEPWQIGIYPTVLCCLGKQCASCLHACAFCEGKVPYLKEAPLNTLGWIKEWHKKFVDSGANIKQAKRYQNMVHQPLIIGDDKDLILQIFNPPELHLLIGTVDKLIMEFSRKVFKTPKEGFKFMCEFLHSVNISRTMKQGGKKRIKLEGNQSDSFLKKISQLEEKINTQTSDIISKAAIFLDCFKAFSQVVQSSFGQKRKEGWNEDIENFSRIYRSLNITVTPKIHMAERHIKDFFSLKHLKGNDKGLGWWSEQAMESVHADFKVMWNRVKVDINHSEFSDRLFSCTTSYNSKHV